MGRIATGIIRTSHGIRGFLKVKTFSGEHQHLTALREITLVHQNREKTFALEEVRPWRDGALIKLKGVDTPEDARNYCSWEIWVDRTEAAALGEDEYYTADLVGMDVLCGGEPVARITAVCSSAGAELLEMVNERGTFLVPFIGQFIGEVSVEDNTIELKDRRLIE